MIKCTLQYILEIKSTQIKSNVGFRGEGKTGVPRENPLGAEYLENQQTQLTYDAESGNRSWATLVGGECSTMAPTLLPHKGGGGGYGYFLELHNIYLV